MSALVRGALSGEDVCPTINGFETQEAPHLYYYFSERKISSTRFEPIRQRFYWRGLDFPVSASLIGPDSLKDRYVFIHAKDGCGIGDHPDVPTSTVVVRGGPITLVKESHRL